MPHYHDCCNHGEECFVGSIETIEQVQGKFQTSNFDVYVFPDKHEGHHVCVRYGNAPEEYLSPGPVTNLAAMKGRQVYRKALELIQNKGRFVYERRK